MPAMAIGAFRQGSAFPLKWSRFRVRYTCWRMAPKSTEAGNDDRGGDDASDKKGNNDAFTVFTNFPTYEGAPHETKSAHRHLRGNADHQRVGERRGHLLV